MITDRQNSKLTFFIFILVIIGLIVLGYFLIKKPDISEKILDDTETLEIDKTKNIVYYDNIDVISSEAQLEYKDIHINLNSDDARELETKLNSNMNKIRGKYTKLEDNSNQEIINEADGIAQAQIIDYNTFNSTNYVTIEVNEYEFLASAMTFDNKLTYYCLDKRSGKLLTNQIIMKQENLSADTIRTKIYDHIKDNDEIDIDVTMNNPYTLYYNEYGKVKANIIVKIGDINYNDNVEIN
ncbi:MAG TPA: hypothetical protein DHU33_02290 [Firmicutes bacterium]|nr:hypothetical protein [Bacillota bacterium]